MAILSIMGLAGVAINVTIAVAVNGMTLLPAAMLGRFVKWSRV
ncbi:MAG: hypothetical protein VYA84_20930 [Planctomycetota bacterium]|nr:hypothetical protein [Planctomycetota bacterium]